MHAAIPRTISLVGCEFATIRVVELGAAAITVEGRAGAREIFADRLEQLMQLRR